MGGAMLCIFACNIFTFLFFWVFIIFFGIVVFLEKRGTSFVGEFLFSIYWWQFESCVRMIYRVHQHSNEFLKSNEDIPIRQSTSCVDFPEHFRKEPDVVRPIEEIWDVDWSIVLLLLKEL